jgi:bifunctional oligoribonuclease and PAP phosphatase NrnA
MIWSELHSIFQNNSTFLISAHVSPDGDSIGCQLALQWYLTSIGKKVSVYNSDPMPVKFDFLKNASGIRHEKPTESFDVLVVLDSSNPDRIGWTGYREIARTVINLDHHRDNTRFGDFNLIRPGAATGEIIYYYFTENTISYPDYVAEYLYTALLTDTGGFRFSNTNDAVLRICADLVVKGARCSEIYDRIYASHSPEGMLLLSRVWATLRYYLSNRVCAMDLPLKLIDDLGATYGDSEGMADLTIMVSGVDVGMLIKHTDTQSHFSLRSRDSVDVGEIAKRVPGGGGHSNAAGCTIEGPIASALPKMLDLIRQTLAIPAS